MEGKVWLVGAGPGDIGLLTLKGKRVLERAEVVVYDHLVGKDILSLVPQNAVCINVGKEAGHHLVSQERINEILVKEAGKGRQVVRLKGGDPFLFGRGGEELLEVNQNGIPFEVVPGVTSPLAVPAYNGIPVTHRDYSSSLHIITGHKKADGKLDIDFSSLVRVGGTLVFLMGVTALGEICAGLLDGGIEPDMPAAVLKSGTTAAQARIVATVGTLYNKVKEAGLTPPAVIVVGKVCQMSEHLSWYEALPLMGMRIIVTRPKELISSLSGRLRELGAEVLELPAIDTVPLPLTEQLRTCLDTIDAYDWIVFTSQVGVRIFFDKLKEYGLDIRGLLKQKFAVIGAGTAKALEERGIFPDVMPDIYDGDALAELLAKECAGGTKILIPRAVKGNPNLVPVLEKAGAVVDDVPVYETVYRSPGCISVKELLEKGSIDCVTFTSSSTVEGFAAVSEGADYHKITAACIGKQTAAAAARYGMKCEIANEAAIGSLVQLIERIGRKRDKETQKIKKR